MATSAITMIEAGLVARLRSKMGASLQVESYGGQLDDDAWEWVRRLPAMWVAFDRIVGVKQLSARTFRKTGRFGVVAAQRAFREPERRLGVAAGTGQDRGVFQLLEDAEEALVGRTLQLPIDPIKPGAITPLLQGRPQGEAIAVYVQAFETWWVERRDGEDADELDPPGELHGIGLTYFLQPDDGVADAADDVDIPA